MQQTQDKPKTTQDKKPRAKKPQSEPKSGVVKTGSHTPFAELNQLPFVAEMNRQEETERQEKAAAKEAAQSLKEREAAKLKEAAAEEKNGAIRNFAREKHKAHPDMPNELYTEMYNAKTKGEAKRLWREYISKTVEVAV